MEVVEGELCVVRNHSGRILRISPFYFELSMNAHLNPKIQYILSIVAIGCISTFMFVFHRSADGLAFHCLEFVPISFGNMGCVKAVTSERWQMLSDTSMLMVVALPFITYVIARRQAITPSIRSGLEIIPVAFITALVFYFSWIHGNVGWRWLCVIALPCISYVIATRGPRRKEQLTSFAS